MGKKKRSRDDWTPPPKSAERRAAEAELRKLRAGERQAPLPQRRLVAAIFLMAVAAIGAFLVLWLPSHSLVDDLRSRGVSVAAEIVTSPRDRFGSPGNIRIRFNDPKRGAQEIALSDWGGRRPAGLVAGSSVSVTYDPRDPSRVLTTKWVQNPPAMTLPMPVSLALAPVLLAGATFLALRRRTVLKASRLKGDRDDGFRT
ncbi:DUF3592 domain-containing protein [Streptomyces sp. NPDC088353]|uniref:DUF3592 domain-containing protein n=1 Tax=Streptomyces sp. NPDC088353 TaxID=3365855 RepID=UPI00381776E0